jgi:ketosteroid isomerase-like protein
MTPQSVAEIFYGAMGRRDATTMASLYDVDATFEDPIFGKLSSKETQAMWTMLMTRARDFSLEFKVHGTQGDRVMVSWTARYTFAKTGRPVINRARTEMLVRSGKIVHHKDDFSLFQWCRQALGLPGLALGCLPPFHKVLRRQSLDQLKKFSAQA